MRPAKPTINPNDLGANFAAALAYLREHYAYLPSPHVRGAAVPKVSSMFEPMAIASLKDEWMAYRMHEISTVTGRPLVKWAHPVDAWAALADRVSGAQCRPDMPSPSFTDPYDKRLYINTWHPPVHPSKGGTIKPFVELMQTVFAVDAEREHFISRMAHKRRHPEVPGTAAVLVAPNVQGTGRGRLFEFAKRLYGEAYVVSPRWRDLVGPWNSHAMAQIVIVNEVRGADDDYRVSKQLEIMEELKQQIDTSAQRLTINFKKGMMVESMTFASYWMATNHLDALPLRREDRRFSVYRCGLPREPEFYTWIDAALRDPANVGAVARWLDKRDISNYDPYHPMQSEIRERMIDASKSRLEEVLDLAFEAMPSEVFQINQMERALDALAHSESVSLLMTPAIVMAAHRMIKARAPRVLNPQLGKLRVFARTMDAALRWHDADPALVRRQLELNEAKLTKMGAIRRSPDMRAFWKELEAVERWENEPDAPGDDSDQPVQ